MRYLALLTFIAASALAQDIGKNVTVALRTVRIPAADFLEKMPRLLAQGASVTELWDSAGTDGVELVGLSSASSGGYSTTSQEHRYPAEWGDPIRLLSRWSRDPSNVYRALGTRGIESKNTGTSLAITAAPTSDGRVSLDVRYQSTGKPEYRTYTSSFPGGTKMLMPQPDFKTSRGETKLQLRKGETRLIGTARSAKPGFFELTLLRLTSHNP